MAMQVDIEFDLYLVVVHSLLTQSIAQRTASDLHGQSHCAPAPPESDVGRHSNFGNCHW